MRNYEQRGHYLNLLQYLYCLVSMLPSKMQNIYLKSVQLVWMVVTYEPCFVGAPVCILFYLCMISRIVLIYD